MVCTEGRKKGAKKVEGEGKDKGQDAKSAHAPKASAHAPKAHAPAPSAQAAAKEAKKSSSWLPSILALPGTGKATSTPLGICPASIGCQHACSLHKA